MVVVVGVGIHLGLLRECAQEVNCLCVCPESGVVLKIWKKTKRGGAHYLAHCAWDFHPEAIEWIATLFPKTKKMSNLDPPRFLIWTNKLYHSNISSG